MFSEEKNREKQGYIYLVPCLCGVFIFTLSVILAFNVKKQQADFLHESLQEESEMASRYIAESIEGSIDALRHMARRWEVDKGTPQQKWRSDARNYVRDYIALTTVEWVDKTYHVQWIEPLKGNEKAMGLNIAFNEERQKALDGAAKNDVITITPPLDLVQGYRAIISYIPMHVDERFDGFMVGVYDLNIFLSKIIQTRNAQAFEYEIYDTDKKVYSTIQNATLEKGVWNIQNDFALFNRNWTINVSYNKEFLRMNETHLGLIIFLTGTFLSVLCTIVVYYSLLVRVQNSDLAKARIEADKANYAKSSFLAGMSHEIRTPMNGVLGTVTLLSDTSLNKKQQKYLNIIKGSGETLLKIINEILDFSRIEAGRLEIYNDIVDIKKTIEHQSSLLEPLAHEKGLGYRIEFEENVPEFLIADKIRIKQIISNLVGNAIKFSDKGSVSINVSVTKKNWKSFLKIAVRDTGIGIKKEEQEKIFGAFEQITEGRKTAKTAGTGLGLSITRRLAEMMGGEIGLISEKGEGSEFWVLIPLKIPTQDVLSETENEEISDVKGLDFKYNILVAEDVLTNQFVISEMLIGMGCKVDFANNGEEAVTAVQEKSYDLVLMDCNMPKMDGYDAVRAIRSLGMNDLPIVALTASAQKSDRQQCLDAGMNDYISKPIDRTEIVRVLVSIATL